MTQEQIEKRIKQGYEYYVKCEVCGMEITGQSIKDVRWNLAVHREKHRREKKK